MGEQSMDGHVTFADSGLDRRHHPLGIRVVGDGIARQAISPDDYCLQVVVVAAHVPLDGGSQVLPEVEAVGDLDRVRAPSA
ncbi:hypothetical protein [Streptomyces sp. NPDC102487]|uniref:hypothetical protein n=1 Tax=Streptomyces sp. NPDC102487 TaxID=3366182 RepID=UPI00381AA77E